MSPWLLNTPTMFTCYLLIGYLELITKKSCSLQLNSDKTDNVKDTKVLAKQIGIAQSGDNILFCLFIFWFLSVKYSISQSVDHSQLIIR